MFEMELDDIRESKRKREERAREERSRPVTVVAQRVKKDLNHNQNHTNTVHHHHHHQSSGIMDEIDENDHAVKGLLDAF